MASGSRDVEWWLRTHGAAGGSSDVYWELIWCQAEVLYDQQKQAEARVAGWADQLDALRPSSLVDARLWLTAMWELDEERLVDIRMQLAVLAEVAMALAL